MDDGELIDALRRAYDAWNRRDINAGLELAADDAEWRGPVDSPFAGPHRGKAQVRKFAEGMFEMFDVIVREPHGFERHGEHVLVEVKSSVRGAGSGVEVEVRLFDVWTVRDGLFTNYAVFSDRAAALDYIAHLQPAATPTGVS